MRCQNITAHLPNGDTSRDLVRVRVSNHRRRFCRRHRAYALSMAYRDLQRWYKAERVNIELKLTAALNAGACVLVESNPVSALQTANQYAMALKQIAVR